MAEQAGKKLLGTINVEPNWEHTAEWFARALSDHSFDSGTLEPSISLIEQIRYLTQKEPDAVERILTKLRNDQAKRTRRGA